MRLPMRAFWLLCNSISRIEADQDQRQLRILISAESPDGAKELARVLSEQVGEVTKVSGEAQLHMQMDRDGFEELRSLSQRGL
jgi:hypothetical protein